MNYLLKRFSLLSVLSALAFSGCMLRKDLTEASGNAFDPTGTYELDESEEDENGDFTGLRGTVYVEKLSANRVAMAFAMVKGAPSYNNGSFVDTLELNGKTAVFKYESCRLTFTFTDTSVTSVQSGNFNCGFGHGVYGDGVFEKVSSEIPEIVNPMTGE